MKRKLQTNILLIKKCKHIDNIKTNILIYKNLTKKYYYERNIKNVLH